MDDGTDLKTLVNLPEDELLSLLGDLLLHDQSRFGPPDSGRRKRYVLAWIRREEEELRRRICRSAAVEALMADGTADSLIEAAVAAEAIMSMFGRPTALVVAAILVGRGLPSFCDQDRPVQS